MAIKGFLGIDAGTQGLAVVFVDEQFNVIASGDGDYEMVPGLEDGRYEQQPADWMAALRVAMGDLRKGLAELDINEFEVIAIGISGQMHGEVLIDESSQTIGTARLWCDRRNEQEGRELTDLLNVKMPKRITAARWLWTMRNRPKLAARVKKITTPAGWIGFCLTGEFVLGIGDASGMFPIDQQELKYDRQKLETFDQRLTGDFEPLTNLLPVVRKAGESGGELNDAGAELLGLPAGIPVAPAEGDQPAALAGSRIAEAGMVSVSFGTSVCANSVGDRSFQGVSDAIDHFCAVDGKPINMVFLRNGTTFMNTIVEMFAADSNATFGDLMLRALKAAPDCGGVVAIPFMDDEPGLGISSGGKASLCNLNPHNASAGNAIRAALTSTIMNLKLGMEVLDEQGYPRTEVILTGGLTRTPELGQILSDVFGVQVSLPRGSDEGTAVGAALLAAFRYATAKGQSSDWSEFVRASQNDSEYQYSPNQSDGYAQFESAYRECIANV